MPALWIIRICYTHFQMKRQDIQRKITYLNGTNNNNVSIKKTKVDGKGNIKQRNRVGGVKVVASTTLSRRQTRGCTKETTMNGIYSGLGWSLTAIYFCPFAPPQSCENIQKAIHFPIRFCGGA